MRNLLLASVLLIGVAAAGFWFVTEPEGHGATAIASGEPDLANGRLVFAAGGCASCHALPGQEDRLLLGGGVRLRSPFGTFTSPNISPDPEHGIGTWTGEQFAAAMRQGLTPEGKHLYPAFPYTAYRHMTPADMRDLFGYIKTLAASANTPPDHDFPLSLAVVRRGVGLWKRLHLSTSALPARGEAWTRGAYLVEALGHCAECHSPRDLTGGVDEARRYGGSAEPGLPRSPNITGGKGGIGDWSEDDIAYMLEDGSTPEGDVVGGDMREVIRNTSQLSAEDRQAMAVYLKSLPAVDTPEKAGAR